VSLLSSTRLHQLIEDGVIRGVSHSAVNATSIDLTVGNTFLTEAGLWGKIVCIGKRIPPTMITEEVEEGSSFTLRSGCFCLAQSQQTFHLPNNISAEFKLKSSLARAGLNHLLAGWCDAGWNGSVLTLELLNVLRHHSIEIFPGDAIGQIIFFEHEPVPEEDLYSTKGRYNGDTTVKGMKE
jgi:dCTP deaminase